MRFFAALVGVAAIANATVALGYLSSRRGEADRAAPPTVAVAPAPSRALDRRALDELFERRSRAVVAGDREDFLHTVDPAATDFAARQRRLFDNLAKLPLASWRYRPTRVQATGHGGWWVRLTLRYRLRGFDAAEVSRHQYVRVIYRPGPGWTVAGDGSASGMVDDPEVWDSGPLTVVEGRRSLVLGTGALEPELRQIADRIDAGVSVVSSVVGEDWSQRAVVLVPSTQEQAARLVGQPQDLGQIAALATVTGEPDHLGDRIVVAPETFPRLNPLGRRVVLIHELTHVATGGARDTRTPMWLVEGLADYVGYKGARVRSADAAVELAREVRNGRLPARLPDQTAFTGSSPRLSQAYQESWLACRLIVGRYGEDRLWRLYQAAGGAAAAEAVEEDNGVESGADGDDSTPTPPAGDPRRREANAIRDVLGIDTTEFVSMWRDYLRRELGS
jgi:hypothetical protein